MCKRLIQKMIIMKKIFFINFLLLISLLSYSKVIRDTLQLVKTEKPVVVAQTDSIFAVEDESVYLYISLDKVYPSYSYQWFFEGNILEGADRDSLFIEGLKIDNSGNYHCVVTSNCYIVFSDSMFVEITSKCNVDTSYVYDTICTGSFHVWGEDSISTEGFHFQTFSEQRECDSVSILHLTVYEPDTTFIFDTIYFGESYSILDTFFVESGLHTLKATNKNGCDSIIKLNLAIDVSDTINVCDTLNIIQRESICSGRGYLFGGKLLNDSGIYFDTLVSIQNCDSVVELHLTVQNPDSVFVVDTLINSSYEINDTSFTEKGLYILNEKNQFGCDSIIVLELREKKTDSVQFVLNLNDSDSITTYYMSGDTVSIVAPIEEGYVFSHWENENGDTLEVNQQYSFVIENDMKVMPIYNEIVDEICSIVVYADGRGHVEGTGVYTKGDKVELKAIPDSGYYFENWTENDSILSDSLVYTFIVNSERELYARFSSIKTIILDEERRFWVFPNPASRLIYIQGNLSFTGMIKTISMVSEAGVEFSRPVDFKDSDLAYIDCSSLSSGSYILIAKDQNKVLFTTTVLIVD